MSRQIMILQSEASAAQQLAEYFIRRGDQAEICYTLEQAHELIKSRLPTLIFIDIHLPGTDWLDALRVARQHAPQAGVILTNRHPDIRREMLAKEYGVRVFLRQPFTANWVENALSKLERSGRRPSGGSQREGKLPRVRIPMRAKITLPYALLALLFALGSAYLISRYVLESLQDRFVTQLIDTGKLSADWLVQQENRMLETLRLLTHTQGMPEAILANDQQLMQSIVVPIAINYQEDALAVLDASGMSKLTLHKKNAAAPDYSVTQGDRSLAQADFMQKVLNRIVDQQGDKFAGWVDSPQGRYFYVSGPVLTSDGDFAGVIAVGVSLERMAQDIRRDTLGQINLYGLDGRLLVTTLLLEDQVAPIPIDQVNRTLLHQDVESRLRELSVGSSVYSEILGPWEARNGQDLGVIGTSLAQNFFTRPSTVTRSQAILIVIFAFLGVIVMGIFVAHQITHPLGRIMRASIEVARGNLQVRVPSRGNDEVSVLAHAFNYMVSGLQEGFVYRDLLGRTVSPEVRETLRQSFAAGHLKLEGQSAVATVLRSDIRGFTTMAEKEPPTTILNWLNEYFGELVPVITSHGGVVDKFEGDAMQAFFGILPRPLSAQESAFQACSAAIEMLEVIERINQRRGSRGEMPFETGIGINTGTLIAGGLGTSDRLNYTVIGDTVNTTQRIESLTREFGDSAVIISENTLTALGEYRGRFTCEPLGEHAFRGKRELLWLYRLQPLATPEEQRIAE